MVEYGISAVPVVDQQGKPVGVLSQTDIVAHDHKKPANAVPEYYAMTDAVTGSSRLLKCTSDLTFSMPVHKLMTPTIFAVNPDDSVTRVVGDMVAFKIHRLFVVDVAGVLLGVISAFDVLRKLRWMPNARLISRRTVPLMSRSQCLMSNDRNLLVELVNWLRIPASYHDGTQRVEFQETHISCVFLTERFAYKLKKPVKFDFADFSSVESRFAACQAEVRLNCRLTTDVYFGVVPVCRDRLGQFNLEGDGQPVEWLVKVPTQ